MKSEYFPPEYLGTSFHCMMCHVKAKQHWISLYVRNPNGYHSTIDNHLYCLCDHCGEKSYWFDGKLVVPDHSTAEPPHPDLPESCQTDYDEASSVLSKSPKAAAALLRLCIQKLTIELGEKGKDLNHDIKSLVKKGLPVQVQQALDICRVIGNESVHPGEIDINDTPEIANKLFTMINFIVEDKITKPKELKELYESLPERKLKQIQERDNPEKKTKAVNNQKTESQNSS